MVPCGRRGTETTLSSPLGFSTHPLPAAPALLEQRGLLLMGPPEALLQRVPHRVPGSHFRGGEKDGQKARGNSALIPFIPLGRAGWAIAPKAQQQLRLLPARHCLGARTWVSLCLPRIHTYEEPLVVK